MKFLKVLLWLLFILVVVTVGAMFYVVKTTDPEVLKAQFSELVKKQTGRDLTITGDVDLSFYPILGFSTGGISLSNHAGFEPEHMLTADKVDVEIKILPLLQKKIEIGQVLLVAPDINLEVKDDGSSNWDDLIAQAGQQEKAEELTPEQEAGAAFGGLLVEGINISNGRVSWKNAVTDQTVELTKLNLETGRFEFDTPTQVDFSVHAASNLLPEATDLTLSTVLTADESLQNFAFEVLSVNVATQTQKLDAQMATLGLDLAEQSVQAHNVSAKGSIPDFNAEVAVADVAYDLATGLAELYKVTADVDGIDLTAKAAVEDVQYAVNTGKVNVKGVNATGDLGAMPFHLDVVSAEVDTASLSGSISSLKAGVTTLGLAPEITAPTVFFNINEQTARLPAFKITESDAVIDASLTLKGFDENLNAKGNVATNVFNARAITEKLGIDLSNLNANVLTAVQLGTSFDGGLDSVKLDNLNAKVDTITAKGNVNVGSIKNSRYQFKLDVNDIDIDALLVEAKAQEVSEQKGAGAAAAVALPLAVLKGLTVDGQLVLGRLKSAGVVLNDLVMNVKSAGDVISIDPLSANLYNGSIHNKVVYDVSGNVPRLNIDTKLTSLNLGPLLKDMNITEALSGVGDLTLSLNGSGADAQSFVEQLNGSIDLNLKDGSIEGFDLQATLLKAADLYQNVKGKPLVKDSEVGDKTSFSDFLGKFSVVNGVIKTKDLSLKAPAFRVEGDGDISLVSQQIDMHLRAGIVESYQGQGGKGLADLKGQAIPISLSGDLAAPQIRLDINSLIKSRLQREIEKKYLGGVKGDAATAKAAAKEKLNDKINEKLAKEFGVDAPEGGVNPMDLLKSKLFKELGLPESKKSAEKQAEPVEQTENPQTKKSEASADKNLTTEIDKGAEPVSESEPEQPVDVEAMLKQKLEKEKERFKKKLFGDLF